MVSSIHHRLANNSNISAVLITSELYETSRFCLLAESRSSWLFKCRDELQAKAEALKSELATAQAAQQSAETSWKELQDRLAGEQAAGQQLQEQRDEATQGR